MAAMYDALFDFCFNHTYFLLLASGIDTNAYISPKKDSQKNTPLSIGRKFKCGPRIPLAFLFNLSRLNSQKKSKEIISLCKFYQ